MDTIEVEREVFDALIERVDFFHKTVKALYEQLRDKKLSDWLTTKQICDYLHISERKLRSMKERGKIGFSHLGRLSQFKFIMRFSSASVSASRSATVRLNRLPRKEVTSGYLKS